MENVILVIHLILALLLIGAVLLQRSEGGALGMGGGGNVMSGRGAATALSKATWGLTAAFIATSLILTIFAAERSRDNPLGDGPGAVQQGAPAQTPLDADGALQDLGVQFPPQGGAGGAEEAAPDPDVLPSLDEESPAQRN